MSSPIAVILAAGKGTRMKSDLPKVLVPVLGRPMASHVLDAVAAAGIQQVLLVVGYRSDLVREAFAGHSHLQFVEQAEQHGTGHAVMVCRDKLNTHRGPVVVLTGDSPLTQASSLKSLLSDFSRTRPACLIGTAIKEDPTGLGRVVRDENGEFVGIVEQKDATPQQQAIKEVNMSTYVFDCGDLLWSLDQLSTDNAQEEYYITDCPGILKDAGKDVRALAALKPCETLSINTVEELAVVEEQMRRIK